MPPVSCPDMPLTGAIQIRIRHDQEKIVDEICADRCMRKMDLLGKILRWFIDLDYDAQGCILGQLSVERQLIVIENVRLKMAIRAAKGGLAADRALANEALELARQVLAQARKSNRKDQAS